MSPIAVGHCISFTKPDTKQSFSNVRPLVTAPGSILLPAILLAALLAVGTAAPQRSAEQLANGAGH